MAETRPKRFDPPPVFWLLLAAALTALAVVLWLKAHGRVASLILAWKHAELQLLGHFTSGYNPLDRAVLVAAPDRLSLLQLGQLFNLVGASVNMPAAATALLLAAIVFFRAPSKRFRAPLDPDGVFREQGAPFRCAGAFLGREQPLIAPSAGQPRPNDFALHTPEWIAAWAWNDRRGLQDYRCRQELARQLGPVWSGPGNADPHARCLFAAFALHSIRERSTAVSLLGDFAQSLPQGELGESLPVPEEIVARADAVLADRQAISAAIEKASQHAFQTTALMTVLEYAREKAGVLAPAQFNGLKLVDRRLWYALHSLGMPNPYVEAIGARDHWAAERLAGVPLYAPSVDRAVITIRNALGDVRTNTPKRT